MNIFKKFSIIVFLIVATFGIITFPFLNYSNYDGDLTRMAMLPEKYFGWTQAQPSINKEFLTSANWTEADILVIGDSFSEKLVWQSKLVEAGYRVRTESWSSLGLICDDFNEWLNAKQFKGSYVIIQSVENSFYSRVKKSLECNKTQYKFLKKKEIEPPVQYIERGQVTNQRGQLYAGLKTRVNQFIYEQKVHDPGFRIWNINENVKVERVVGGCELFSHPRCDDVLFYRKTNHLNLPELVQHINLIQQKIAPRQLFWLVIPDKSTAYLDHNTDLYELNVSLKESIDVLGPLKYAIENKQLDVYFGNDTHLSTRGYGVVGEAVRDYLKNR